MKQKMLREMQRYAGADIQCLLLLLFTATSYSSHVNCRESGLRKGWDTRKECGLPGIASDDQYKWPLIWVLFQMIIIMDSSACYLMTCYWSPCISKFYSQSISIQLCWISSFTVNLHLSVHIPCHFFSFHDWSSQKNLSLLITSVGPRLQDLIINSSQLFTVWAVFPFFKLKCFFFVNRNYCWSMWHVSLSG